MMLPCLVCLTILSPANDPPSERGGETVYEEDSGYAPPDTRLPIPVGPMKEDDHSVFFLGGFSGPGGGSMTGAGWRFRDDSVLEARRGTGEGLAEVTYRRSVREDETHRYSVVAGSRVGVRGECYLGWGFAAAFDLGVALLRGGSPPSADARIEWYPVEGIQVSLGCDLTRGRWECGWTITP